MAKKSANEVNKSEKIREYLRTARRAKTSTVVAALAEQGIEVTPQFVSTVKTNSKRRKKKKGGREGTGVTAAPKNDKLSLSTLLQAKKLAEHLGGVAKAKAALDALAKLQ